jgi:CRISPR/Cas system CMR subunit Cmr6 (Cas7 group RAMP superfamily)
MLKLDYNIRLLTPLIHSEETQSNVSNLFREKRIINNKIYYIPAIKGNSIRGIMRNLIFEHLLKTVQIEDNTLSPDLFYILFCGGFLEGMDGEIDMQAKKAIRDVCPALSILGSALKKEMLRGKLIISSMYPKCKELGTGELSIYDITNITRYTRTDDSKLAVGDKFKKAQNKEGDPIQMFYDVETLNAGVDLNWFLALDSQNDIEQACLYRMIKELANTPFLGGKSSAGHGQFEFINLDVKNLNSSAYDNFLQGNKDKIKDWLLSYA